MATVELLLDALNLACSLENTRLTATPVVTFQYSDPAVASLTQAQLLRALRTARAVAKRGAGCKIDIEVDHEGVEIGQRSMLALRDNMALAICEAPWWSQLPVYPVLERSPDSCSGGSPSSITIKDKQPDFLSENNQNASLDTEDIKVPGGILLLRLQRISISLKFHVLVRENDLCSIEVSGDPVDMLFEGSLTNDDDVNEDQLLIDDYGPAERDIRAEDWTSSETAISALEDGFEGGDSFLLDDIEYNVCQFFPSDDSPLQSQESVRTHLTVPYVDAQGRHHTPPSTVNEAAARALVNVAMRTLVGGAQRTPTDDVQLIMPLPKHALALLMPLLFSPNFSGTMSSRSCFLPRITNTIASLGSASQSPVLKTKLAKLVSSGAPDISRHALAAAVQARSYRIMHTSLFSAKSGRCLRTGRDEKVAVEEDSMIIDGPAVSAGRRTSQIDASTEEGVEISFEDMLEDEPLSEDEVDMLLDLEIMRQQRVPSCSVMLTDMRDGQSFSGTASIMDMDGDGPGGLENHVEDVLMNGWDKSENIGEMGDGSPWMDDEDDDDVLMKSSDRGVDVRNVEVDLASVHVDMLF